MLAAYLLHGSSCPLRLTLLIDTLPSAMHVRECVAILQPDFGPDVNLDVPMEVKLGMRNKPRPLDANTQTRPRARTHPCTSPMIAALMSFAIFLGGSCCIPGDAAEHGDVSAVTRLLQAGANVKATDWCVFPSVFYACICRKRSAPMSVFPTNPKTPKP